uniref:Putative an1-type zinc finger protein 2b n=1 Tax=Culex tarsalis TaxID=7177 RepID=A0A1Q3F2X5_CULTA
MEFPHLGKHCSEKYCHKLDFLPMKCDACGEIFCSEHFSYQTHSCLSAARKDVQVPVCPLCSEPVPTPRDVSPDVTVGAHIDQFCRSERKKIYTNRCTYRNCKKKELIPVSCTVCRANFCLKHRHTTDHDCPGTGKPVVAPIFSKTAQAALQRQQQRQPAPLPVRAGTNVVAAIQGTMSEDEALARALALSMQEEEDDARASASRGSGGNASRSIPVGGNAASSSAGKDKCNLS